MVIGGVAGGRSSRAAYDRVLALWPGHRRRAAGNPGVIMPAQPERLRRDHGDLRVEVQQHHMTTRSASGTRACSAKSSTAGRSSMEIRSSHSSAGCGARTGQIAGCLEAVTASRPRITRGSEHDSQLASFADRFPELLVYPGTANQLSPMGMARCRGGCRDNVTSWCPGITGRGDNRPQRVG